MQQQAGLPHDPALIAAEINADQAEVLLGGQVEGSLFPAGAGVVCFQDQAVAAHQEAVLAVGEGHSQGVGLGVDVHRLPGAGAGGWQTGADAAREADAKQQREGQGGERSQQALEG